MVEIRRICENKKNFIDLLLLADEQEEMIGKYLENGDMFALYDDDLKSLCVVVQIDDRTVELKNIATYEKYQGLGYGKKLVEHIFKHYEERYKTMIVGTGDSPSTIGFYEHLGFVKSHKITNFFTDNYDHIIFEGDIQLIDMIYLKRDL